MNTVFKRVLRYVTSIKIVVLLASLLLAFQLQANQCARLEFVATSKNDEVYVAMISVHNDLAIEKTDNKYDILDGEHSYYLEEGLHTLIVEQWPAKKFRRLRKDNRIRNKYLPVDKSAQIISLNVTAGRHYQLEYQQNQQQPTIVIKNESAESCSVDISEVMTAKVENSIIDVPETIELPNSLEYRLRKLMNKLASYHHIEKLATNNYIHARINAYIGTSIDNEYKHNGKALKVLSVLPYSLAHKLQLMSGDEITHLGGEAVRADRSHPNEQLNDYFNELQFGDEIVIDLLRNKESKQLVGIYEPNIVPELSYQLGLSDSDHKSPTVNQLQKLPIELLFELDQLAIELSNYYQSKNYNQQYINIVRKRELDKKIGFSGNKVVLPKNVGLKVYEVEENSLADHIGLKVNDIVVSINKASITANNINHILNSLTEFKKGDDISISVIRENKLLNLNGEYLSQELISFNLLLDLNSIEIANVNLENKSKFWKIFV